MAHVSIERNSEGRSRARARAVGLRLDGRAWLRVTEFELAELALADGDHVDEANRSELEHRLARVRSKAFVIRSLAARAQSVAELERKLAARAIPPEIATESIELVRGYGYLDDEALAHQLARELRARGYGRRRAAGLLWRRGIQSELAETTLCEVFDEDDERADARRALGSRAIGASERDRRRAVAFLLRRGFSSGAAWAAVDGASRTDPG